MSEGKSKSGFDKVINNVTRPEKTEDHLDVWAEETFDRLSKQTKHQKKRQMRLESDLGELLDTYDELTDSYVD